MKKVTVFLIAVVVAIAFAFLVPAMLQKEQAQKREAERIARIREEQLEQLRPLMSEKQTLQRAINKANSALAGDQKQAGMTAILYRSPSQQLQEDVLKLMNTYGIRGTILITPQAFPGQEGYLSVNELQRLTDAGWDLCVPYMDEDALAQLLNQILQYGLPTPQSLLLEDEAANAMASYIGKYGFKAVICMGQEPEAPLNDALSVRAYSHRENSTTINAIFEPLQSSRSYIAVTVGFAAEDADAYSNTRMVSILDYCAYYGIAVAPVSELAADHLLATSAIEDKTELTTKLEQLNQRLTEVQQQIDEINRQLAQ